MQGVRAGVDVDVDGGRDDGKVEWFQVGIEGS